MSNSHPSIQSFYARKALSSSSTSHLLPTPTTQATITSSPQHEQQTNPNPNHSSSTFIQPIRPGDGFTEEELAEATDPMTRKWNPSREYEEKEIGELVRGLNGVVIVGRIVNFSEILGKSQAQPKARGWHNMLVRDDTGVVQVKLYFSHKSYPLKIGQLVTIWTTFVSFSSDINNNVAKNPDAPLAISIFPGRDTSCHIMVHLKSDTGLAIKTPLGCQERKPLPGLMTLKNFIQGGHEVENSKILVCVKSIGLRKQIQLKNGGTNHLVEIQVQDDTEVSKLNLWGVLTDTGKSWTPNSTILLITAPIFKYDARGNGRGNISLTSTSMVDVDPQFRDAAWLKGFVVNMCKKESVKQEIPQGLFNVKDVVNGLCRIVWTLKDIDLFIRHNPNATTLTGFSTLLLPPPSLVLYHSRNMLLVSEHCGVPLYSQNTPITTCKNCNSPVKLSLNPKIIGRLVDETGCIGAGRLLWSEEAWEDLFGRKVEEVVRMEVGELRLLEQRMGWLRFTFVWGWAESIGKLAILGVRE